MTPIESISLHLKDLSEDMAKSVESQAETSRSLAALAETVQGLQVDKEVTDRNQKLVMDELVALRAEAQEMIALFKNYVADTANLRSEVRKVVTNGQR